MPSPQEGLRALRLLVVERSGWIARTLASVLQGAGWSLLRAEDAYGAIASANSTSPDVILVHGDLGDADVVELCARLRARPHVGPVTPIIVLSADATRARRIAALRAGAWDFLAEPLDTEAFLLKLETLALSHRDVERLASSALVETETGLYNRAGLARRAEEVAADTKRRHAPLSCVVFAPGPVDWRRGAPETERVVAWAGAVVRQKGRTSDVIARLDGVLAVVAPATPVEGAQRLATRLRDAIRNEAAADQRATPPIRAAYCTAGDFARSTLSVEQMLERAIQALSRARLDDEPAAVPGETVPLEHE
jgi:PleD family two-component response regulator